MNAVFPAVFEVPLAEERVLLAFREPVSLDALRRRLAAPGRPGELSAIAREAAVLLRPAGAGRAPILTDDRAPVEPLTRGMIERRARRPASLSG